MNESIYNNAGMPSGQKDTQMSDGIDVKDALVNERTKESFPPSVEEQIPEYLREIPEDLRGDYQTMQMHSERAVICVRPSVITEFIERIAALTLERDTLKTERDERAEQVRRYDKAIGVLTEDNASLKAKVVRMSAPPEPLVFTCPFDGEVWRFHTQEQLGRLEKHLEWHATNINSKE